MDCALWLFCVTESEGPVPYPWERFYDLKDEIVYYKNTKNKTVVFDLRNRVKLGGSLVHYNRKKKAITGRLCEFLEQKSPVVIVANCCALQNFFYIPEFIQRCPMCSFPVIYIPHFG